MNEKPRDMIRVVLADDHEMVRQGLAQILQDSEEIVVVGEAGNGIEAVKIVEKQRPDVVVLDYTMPGLDGIDAIKEIWRRAPEVKILVLTVHENFYYATRVLKAGANGFVLKSAAVEELVNGIKTVHAGRNYVSTAILEKMTEYLAVFGREKSGLQALSKREFDLLRLLGSGKRLNECANIMKITVSTASTYRARLLEKLTLESTSELIRFALENGIDG